MKAVVDQEVCIGCSLCTQLCPDLFEMKDDKSSVLKDPVPDELAGCAKDAADQCPVEAITIE